MAEMRKRPGFNAQSLFPPSERVGLMQSSVFDLFMDWAIDEVLRKRDEQGLDREWIENYEAGFAEGFRIGTVKARRITLIDLGADKLGPPPADAFERLDGIEDPDELRRLVHRVLRVDSWSALLEPAGG